MRDALEVLQEYAARNAGNEWARRLARMKTHEAVPGEPARGGVSRVQLREWLPEPGEVCLHVGAAGRPRTVTLAAVEGRFARVIVDGEWGEWALLDDLQPLVRP